MYLYLDEKCISIPTVLPLTARLIHAISEDKDFTFHLRLRHFSTVKAVWINLDNLVMTMGELATIPLDWVGCRPNLAPLVSVLWMDYIAEKWKTRTKVVGDLSREMELLINFQRHKNTIQQKFWFHSRLIHEGKGINYQIFWVNWKTL